MRQGVQSQLLLCAAPFAAPVSRQQAHCSPAVAAAGHIHRGVTRYQPQPVDTSAYFVSGGYAPTGKGALAALEDASGARRFNGQHVALCGYNEPVSKWLSDFEAATGTRCASPTPKARSMPCQSRTQRSCCPVLGDLVT